MALTKTPIMLLASGAVAAGSTKAAPGRDSGSIDCRGYYGGLLTYSITNGSTAPSAPVMISFQVSGDGTTWRDFYYPMAGDVAAGSNYTNTLDLPRGAMYVRAIAYGNSVQPVTVAVELQSITAL